MEYVHWAGGDFRIIEGDLEPISAEEYTYDEWIAARLTEEVNRLVDAGIIFDTEADDYLRAAVDYVGLFEEQAAGAFRHLDELEAQIAAHGPPQGQLTLF